MAREPRFCKTKVVPDHLHVHAAQVAVEHNPANAPNPVGVAALALLGEVPLPGHLALLTSKWWGSKGVNLTVSFIGKPHDGAKLLAHMNAWGTRCNVRFTEKLSGGQVRVAFEADGLWSFLGTDVLVIPGNQQTMNLEGFDGPMPDSEYLRVVRHETGHTLGFPHEHQRAEIVDRLDPAKTIAYFQVNDGWDAATTTQQVLTPIGNSELRFLKPADQRSIMCYDLPGSITKDGQPILGGGDIDDIDWELAASVYPQAVTPPPPPPPPPVAKAAMQVSQDLTEGNWTAVQYGWPPKVSHLTVDGVIKAGKKHEVT